MTIYTPLCTNAFQNLFQSHGQPCPNGVLSYFKGSELLSLRIPPAKALYIFARAIDGDKKERKIGAMDIPASKSPNPQTPVPGHVLQFRHDKHDGSPGNGPYSAGELHSHVTSMIFDC